MYSFSYVSVDSFLYVYIYTFIYIHIYMYIYVYMYTHVYIHICVYMYCIYSDKAPTNKIYRRASSEQRPRTRSCHESERLV